MGLRILTILFFFSVGICSQTVTYGEIYDFEIGDEVHEEGQTYTIGQSRPSSTYTTKYIGKIVVDSTTIKYIRRNASKYMPTFPGQWVINTSIDTLDYGDLTKLIPNIDTQYVDTTRFNGRNVFEENSWGFDTGYTNRYIEGIGTEYYSFDGTTVTEIRIIYYKKGDEEWGNKQFIGIDNDANNQKTKLMIYPNPVSDVLTIYLPNTSGDGGAIRIQNIAGKVLMTSDYSIHNNTINISELSEGLYLISVIRDGQVWNGKFLKE